MDMSIFEQVTSALTVKSICTSLGPDIPAESTDLDLSVMHCEADLDPFNNPSRVIGFNGSVIGMIWFEDYAQLETDGDGGSRTVEEAMQRLEPSEILSSSTSILDAVDIFGSKPNRYFYVVHIADIVGVVFYRDLFKPLGRLAFLALALEIEDYALTLCGSASINERCWQSLSDNRKFKAIELFKLRYGREPKLRTDAQEEEDDLVLWARPLSDISLLIGCTNLVDKATMIWKQKLIPAAKQADVLGFFNDLREIRDQCAHPGRDEELIPKERLAHFVNSAKCMRSSLRESVQRVTTPPTS